MNALNVCFALQLTLLLGAIVLVILLTRRSDEDQGSVSPGWRGGRR
jgi:hypothetical protein